MIVPSDSKDKASTSKASEAGVAPESFDPPPTYTPSTSDSPSISLPSSSTQCPSLPRLKPCNLVSLTRENNSIKEDFLLDPSLHIPSGLLPPLAEGESDSTRKNLRLLSKNGSVSTEIVLLAGDPATDDSRKNYRRTTLDIKSQNGSVTARIRTVEEKGRRPIVLVAHSANGSVTVYIPRSFRGFLTIGSKNGSICFSDEVKEYLSTLSEVNSIRRCFLGDFEGWDGESEWIGDEAEVTSNNGRVRVNYVDDLSCTSSGKASFWSRMLGR